MLIVLYPDGGAEAGALEAIARDYLRRFDQQAVLRAARPVCVDFLTEGK